MVTVKVSETYDLSTRPNKMGIVGIHTPKGQLISRHWAGFVAHYKKFRFVSCDVAMACASMLPADPLQIGVEAGSIAPQDMFNPILYRAVSNESMGNILSFLMSGVGGQGAESALNQGSIVDVNDADIGHEPDRLLDQFNIYYSLLSDTEGWRKSMPQAGLEMTGLYPLVYQVVSNFGSVYLDSTGNFPNQLESPIPAVSRWESQASPSIVPAQYRGPSMRMPAIDTTYYITRKSGTAGFNANAISVSSADADNKYEVNLGDNTQTMPPCYVGLIVLPPAKLNRLYYRLKVTWTVEFTGVRSLTDVASWGYLNDTARYAYGTDYVEQSANMSSKESMVDSLGADLVKIMEGR